VGGGVLSGRRCHVVSLQTPLLGSRQGVGGKLSGVPGLGDNFPRGSVSEAPLEIAARHHRPASLSAAATAALGHGAPRRASLSPALAEIAPTRQSLRRGHSFIKGDILSHSNVRIPIYVLMLSLFWPFFSISAEWFVQSHNPEISHRYYIILNPLNGGFQFFVRSVQS